jgi:hypothetical protein
MGPSPEVKAVMRINTLYPAALLAAGLFAAALLPARADDNKAEEKADKPAAAALAGKEVQLTLKDESVAKAVEDLAKKSGYAIKLHDPDGKTKDKKVTLDTGKTTFWTALAQLCEKAGLTDDDPNRLGAPAAVLPMPGAGLQPLPPVQGVPALPGGPKKIERKEGKKQEKDQNAADEQKPAQGPRALPAQAPGGLPAPGGLGKGLALPAPGGAPMMPVAWVPVEPGQIVLVPAKAQKPADTKTSVRVRAAESRMPLLVADKDHLHLFLELTVEPRLRWQKVGAVKITKATDDNDQKLESVEFKLPGPNLAPMPLPVNPGAGPGAPALPAKPGAGGGVMLMPAFVGFGGSANGLSRVAPLQFKKDKKETKSFKELSGTAEVTLLTESEAMITADNVMKLEGKSAKGKKGGEIAVRKVTKEKDGTVVIEFSLELPEKVQPDNEVNVPIPADARPAPLPLPGGAPLPLPGGAPLPAPLPPVEKKGNAAAEPKPLEPKPAQGAQLEVDGPAVALRPMLPTVQRYALQGLTLQDAKGKTIYGQITYDFAKMKGLKANQTKFDYVVRYKAGKDMPAEPAKLVFTGRPVVEVKVPFTLKDVGVN